MRTDTPMDTKRASGGAAQGPPEGRMERGVHVFPVRVYYEDTDVGGVVYYANYLKFAERARTEMLRLIGFPHSAMQERDGLAFAVRRCEADYIRPAHFDDALEVHTAGIDVQAAGLWLEQRIKRNGEDLAVLRVRLACVGRNGRPARLPGALRRTLGSFAGARNDAAQGGSDIDGQASIRERV